MRRITFLSAFAALFALLCAATVRSDVDELVGMSPDWCAISGSVDIAWQLDSGAPPYTVTVAGIVAETDAERVTISCADLRAWVTDGLLLQSVEVALPVRIVDASGEETRVEPTILLLAAAPPKEMLEMSLIVGYTNLHLYPKPWPVLWSESSERPTIVAVFRYRPLGAADWMYAMPFPSPPQSGGFSLASHVDDLNPAAEYELQAAWVWYAQPSTDPKARWERWSWGDAMDAGAWDEAAHWWREWNEPRAVRWSTTHRFQAQSLRLLDVQATGNALKVSWLGELSEHSRYFVTVQSDDWPGVFWGDRQNPRVRYDLEPEQNVPMTATLSGLPLDSTFDVTLVRALPSGFAAEPPATVRVRTHPASADLTPHYADPRGVVIRAGAHDIRVQLHAHRGEYVRLSALPLIDGQVLHDHEASRQPDQQRKLPAGGTEFALVGLPKGTAWRLYVNVYPGSGDSSPFVCVVRDVQLASRYPDDWFDHYFYSSASHGGDAAVSPADPGLPFPHWSYCTLAHIYGE